MKVRKEFTCPLELVHDMIKGKWKPVILWQIHYHGKVSLSQLEREIKGLSQKMLLQHLKELQCSGFVQKKQYDGYPLRVEYSLTPDKGRKLVEALAIMQGLGQEYLDDTINSQQ